MSAFQQCKERGNSFFQRQQYDQAIEWYAKALAEDPNAHAVYTNRAAAYFNTQRLGESLADAQSAVQLEPTWTKGHYRIGMVHLKQGNARAAIEAFNTGLDTDPTNAQIKAGLAEAKTAADQQPVDHREAKAKGNECYQLSQYEEAVKWYTRALEMCPVEDVEATATLLTNRAESHRQMSQDQLTIQDCTAALALAPHNLKALLRRGLAYERREMLQAALEDLRKALALHPGTQMASQGVLRITKLLKYDAAQ